MSRNNYLAEAFKSMRSDDILNEEAFTLDSKGADELKHFLDGDNVDDSVQSIDPDAKTPEELKDSYIGKVILDCCVCHSKLYKDKEDVIIDEDGDLANVDEECPFCYCVDGFKIVGEVKEFDKDDSDEDEKGEEDDEPKPEEKDEVEVEETEEDEKIEESLSSEKKLREDLSYGELVAIADEWKKFKEKKGDSSAETAREFIETECKGVYDTDEEKEDVFAYISAIEEPVEVDEGRMCEKKKLREAPNYELHPRYDARQSFYGKARVDTGDKGDKNKLYSYDTLVAEMIDGKPVVYGTYSATTPRHIKDWLKQNGFKAENKAQILRDYGVKKEEKECEGDKCEGKCRKHDIKRIEEGWRGSEEIEMIWHGSTADPELEYKGSKFNYWDIENALWDMFLEETGHKDSEANDAEVEKEFNKYIGDHATDYLDDLIATMDEGKECVTESVEEVSVKTDKEDISVRTDEDGKVSVETSVKEETDEGAEEIAPVSDEVKAEIEDDSEEAEIGDEIDVEMTDFDEESFDELGEAYLKKAYSNVESYKSVSATANDNRITVEGVIKFKSGNEKKTKFVLESKEVTKSGKSRFVGENLQIAKGKKAFTVFGTLSEGRFVTESLGYDYRAKDKNGKSKRISGTVTKR